MCIRNAKIALSNKEKLRQSIPIHPLSSLSVLCQCAYKKRECWRQWYNCSLSRAAGGVWLTVEADQVYVLAKLPASAHVTHIFCWPAAAQIKSGLWSGNGNNQHHNIREFTSLELLADVRPTQFGRDKRSFQNDCRHYRLWNKYRQHLTTINPTRV